MSEGIKEIFRQLRNISDIIQSCSVFLDCWIMWDLFLFVWSFFHPPLWHANSSMFLFQSFPLSKSKPKPYASRRLSEEDLVSPYSPHPPSLLSLTDRPSTPAPWPILHPLQLFFVFLYLLSPRLLSSIPTSSSSRAVVLQPQIVADLISVADFFVFVFNAEYTLSSHMSSGKYMKQHLQYVNVDF